jgi:mRNA interferase YafQ
MLIPRLGGQFKRDVRKVEKRGKDMGKLHVLLDLLLNEQPLPEHYRDHPLKGAWAGFRDAHIEPDWLLIYCVEDDELQLARTGAHSDVFDE